MNYRKIYTSIIERARDRIITVYTEKHHIIPRCMGGTDDKNNIVCLTPEEHYLAHQLLVKIYPYSDKLVYAAMLMTQAGDGSRVNNKLYGWIKKRLSIARSKPHSEEHKKNNSLAQLSRLPTSDKTRAKMSRSRKGVKKTEEHKLAMSASQKGRTKTPDQIEKTRQASLKVWTARRMLTTDGSA